MSVFTESIVEHAAFAWLESLGYAVLHCHRHRGCGNKYGPDLM